MLNIYLIKILTVFFYILRLSYILWIMIIQEIHARQKFMKIVWKLLNTDKQIPEIDMILKNARKKYYDTFEFLKRHLFLYILACCQLPSKLLNWQFVIQKKDPNQFTNKLVNFQQASLCQKPNIAWMYKAVTHKIIYICTLIRLKFK